MTPWDKIIAVRDIEKLPHVQKIILFVLSTHIGNNEFAFPSLTTLEKECGITRTSLSENISKLILSGLLTKLPPSAEFKSNRYKVNFESFYQYRRATSSPELLVVENYQPSSLELPDQYGRTTSLVVEDYPKEQLKEIKKQLNKKPSCQDDVIELPDFILKEDWEAFLEHRKSLKAPLSSIAQKRAISTLKKLQTEGSNATDVLNQSIVNGWKGLFPVSNNNQRNANGKRKESVSEMHWRLNTQDFRAAEERRSTVNYLLGIEDESQGDFHNTSSNLLAEVDITDKH